jgi:hypothetical protein
LNKDVVKIVPLHASSPAARKLIGPNPLLSDPTIQRRAADPKMFGPFV